MPQPPPSSRPGVAVGAFALVALLVALAAAGVWWVQQDGDPSSSGASDAPESPPASASDPSGATTAGSADTAAADDRRVVVISVDGLGSLWVSRRATPGIADLLAQGAGTLNARTEVEKTVTLPNHTGMVTGDRVDPVQGGHGVTWNSTSTRSVALGTQSVFSVVDAAGGTSAVYAGKQKFEMWGRAWPGTIDPLEIDDQASLVTDTVEDLRAGAHDLVFLHLAGPDNAGHEHGWGSPAYLDAVRTADADVDRVVSAVADDPALAEEVVVIVTADHGGVPGTTTHSDRTQPENFTIPFVVWGAGVTPGDLYDLNPDYRDPVSSQPSYDGPQPVRNGDVANLVTDLLGLDPVPGSLFDTGHDLDVE